MEHESKSLLRISLTNELKTAHSPDHEVLNYEDEDICSKLPYRLVIQDEDTPCV